MGVNRRIAVLLAALGFLFASCGARVHPVLALSSRMTVAEHGYDAVTTSTMQKPLAELEARLMALGLTLRTIPEDAIGGAYGQTDYTDPKHIIISLRDTLSVDARFEVLAHEAAHAFQPEGLSRSDYEVFAELVQWGVSKHYGRDTTRATARYLANWKESHAIAYALKADIKQTIDILIGKEGILWQ